MLLKISIRLVCFFAAVIMIVLRSEAQECRHYTAIQGFLGTDVTAIAQTENYLWFATNEGLNRFDGHQFKVYKKESHTDNCLSENNIESLMCDSNGLLWIGLKNGGVDIYNPREDRFTHISKLTDNYPGRVMSIYEDSQKNIWLGSWENGLYKLEPDTDQPFAYTVSNFFEGYIVSDIVEKPKGYLWVSTYSDFSIYDIKKREWLEMENNTAIFTQLLDSGEEHLLWGATWEDGLLEVRWEEGKINKPEIKQHLAGYKNIYRVFPAKDNRMLLGTWGEGMKAVQYTGENVVEIPPYPLLLEAPVIRCFYRDNYDRLWVGTYGNGLYQLDMEESGMSKLAPINRNGISAVYSVSDFDEKHLVIGTQGDGLYLLNTEKQQLIPKPIIGANALFDNYILSLYIDEQLLIVGHDGNGINYAAMNQKENTSFTLRQFYENNLMKVTSIYKGNDNRFWFGTKQTGLMSAKYDVKNDRFTDFNHYTPFGNDEITGFVAYGTDRLWISSHSGLYLFNTKTNRIENFPAVVNDMVFSMVDDPGNGCLWLGTSVGLRRFDYSDTVRMEQVLPPELLPEGMIFNLLLDEDNNLWFSISDRIFCFLNKERKLKEINPKNNGNQIFISSTQAIVNGSKRIIFGGTESLLCLEPVKALNQQEQARIVCTELQIDHRKVNVGEEVYGRIVLHETPEYVSSVTLSYLCKWISLSFTEVGWDYYRNKYQYRIEGFSDSWQYMDITKPLTFSQLQPGEYTLSIRQYGAGNLQYSWNMQIIISPPWWQTYWFYGALVILFLIVSGMSAWSIRNYYRKRQQQRIKEIEKKKKEELLQEKESFLAGLSHDLLTPLSLVISPTNDLLRKRNLPEEDLEKLDIVARNASFLSDIFGTMFDFKRAEMLDLDINEKTVELVSFMKIIVHAFEYLARSKNINLTFQSNVSELTVLVDTVKLERIAYNILSNSMKFTPDNGSVTVSLQYEDHHYTISVSDTGIGIDTRHLVKVFDKFYQIGGSRKEKVNGLGLGLYIVQKFVLILGGNVYIDSKPTQGTTIRVDLPAKSVDKLILDIREEQSDLPSILLVEDNNQLRDYLRKEFSRHFQVTAVSNGVQALDFIKNSYPEIVITDIMMPEMDGIELCSIIKTTPLLSDIFVVLLSARSATEDELSGYKAGADFYVKKPFDAEVLIKQVLNVYHTRQHRRRQTINEILTVPGSGKTDTVPKDDFLHKAVGIIEKHLMDENFKTDEFAVEMNMSKPVLYRKFKQIIGETPNIFIRNVRLQKAANMLKTTDLSVAEVACLTGFNQTHYFIKCFRELFGKTPKNYQKTHEMEKTSTQINPKT